MSAANSHNKTLLLIEDDAQMREQLQLLLHSHGYQLDIAADGETGASMALTGSYDLVLLDIRLPDIDGFNVLQLMRQRANTPVIVLSACGAEADRIQGFTHGADDYLAKPYSFAELLLRIEAVLRRSQPQAAVWQLQYQELTLDRRLQKASCFAQYLPLTPVEFRLLWALVQQPQQVLSKRVLYPLVLDRTFTEHDRSLDMHLSRLRKKLASCGFNSERLVTLHGKGFRLL
ncbi:MAG: DNA-binding response regulator [Gammaproteobacteria bacterium HGW-Gammaproteobacteria-15]|nr:MAG: DNA-binding response regulator [Gammaproteobacteria bacterium HGW-Gammaproteobacteria-15]